jgi:hypothetical protein
MHRSNLSFPNSEDKVDKWKLAYAHYHVWNPRKRLDPPRGAYDFDPELRTRGQAKEYWREGFMTGWYDKIYTERHGFPYALLPGDKRPELEEEEE